MRKTMVALVAIPLILLLGLASCLAVVKSSQDAAEQNGDCGPANPGGTVFAASELGQDSSWYSDLTVYDGDMKEDQADVAAKIASIVQGRTEIPTEYKERAIIIALITGIVESRLRNVRYGHSDSAGVFQQRPSQGWGTFAQVTDVTYATNKFLDAMLAHPAWKTAPQFGDVAADVQRPALQFRYRYQTRVPEAQKIYAALGGVTSTVSVVGNCVTDPIEEMVQAALSRTGDTYEWEDSSGAGLVSWAFGEAGITFPNGLQAQLEYEGNEDEGVEVEVITADDITSAESLQRGDIVFVDDNGDGIPDSVGIEPGPGYTRARTEFRVGTYNITVKQQFADYPRVIDNIKNTYKMDIVGTQELENENYRVIQRGMTQDGTFGIYPDKKPGEAIVRHGTNARAILYRTDRFVLDESRSTFFRYPRYPEDGKAQSGDEVINAGQANAPVAYFTEKVTGRDVIVIGFHNAAFRENAERRYRANLIVNDQIESLQAQYPGVPIFLPTDANEGTGVRGQGDGANYTYQQRQENLLYWMFRRNNLMFSTEDKSRGQTISSVDPPLGGVDYIYASQGVQVVPNSFTEIPREVSGSDHPAKFVDVVLPGVVNTGSDIPEKWLSTTVGRDKGLVNLKNVDSRSIVKVLRPTVSDVMLVADGTWVFPLKPGDSYYSDAYGLEDGRFHQGADFGTYGLQAPLYAMHGGEILQIGSQEAWGNYILVETNVPYPGRPGETLKYLYAHMSSFAPGLSQGGTLETGQFVGNVGDTGNSYGAHLHLTMGYDIVFMGGSSVGSAGSEDPLILMGALGIWPQEQAA